MLMEIPQRTNFMLMIDAPGRVSAEVAGIFNPEGDEWKVVGCPNVPSDVLTDNGEQLLRTCRLAELSVSPTRIPAIIRWQ